jgi:hypothetical protein
MKKWLKVAGLVLAISWLGWFLRPFWHGFVMFFYTNPAIWESLLGTVITVIIAAVIEAVTNKEYEDRIEELWWVYLVLFFVFLGVLTPLQKMYSQCWLSQHLKVTRIKELPEINPSTPRIVPMEVSYRYAKDALQYPRYQLGKPDIAFKDGKPYWVYGLIPDGFVNFFLLKDKGAMYVDMAASEKRTGIVEKEMKIGEGMGISDWYRWVLYKKRYWVDYEDPYFVPYKKELYIAVPVISYEYHWRFPTLFTVPKWAGTALIHSDGSVEILRPEEALSNSVLEQQKLFPERLSRYYVDSFRYIHGIVNVLFYHEDQLEIADLNLSSGTEGMPHLNKQPYLIMTKKGMKWFVACEPYGEAHGVFKIFLFDARTGKIEVYERPLTEALLGPVRACDYVRKGNPIIDWSRMIPVEPLPVIYKGNLYWQVRVIPKDASGIAYTAMVNAETAEIIELKTDDDVRRFLQGEHKEKVEVPKEVKKVRAIVVIREGGKEIQRIELRENQRIEVIPAK